MPKVFLVNPSNVTPGYSFITPRWLFVLAGATPVELAGDPILTDESLQRFDPNQVSPGDVVGIGISSGNCLPGYRVLTQAKERGAKVVVGGIHATIFPEEPLRMGADSVVTGNGDLIWRKVVEDALAGRLQQRYDGGRVPGESMAKARWDLLDPAKYMMASIQTVAGCPENCSFCSVWVTDGRKPRQRLAEKVIEEANELYRMGFRYIVFADDNFNPATLARIAREPSLQVRQSLEAIRDERLRFFEQYHRSVPDNLYAFTQMTAEIVDDEEYLRGMRDHMRIRTALVGVESFDEQGLEAANKQWNPCGQEMVRTIQTIQERGILVLASYICGLESDSVNSLRVMRRHALESGAVLAQFTVYYPLPGTKDYHEMVRDRAQIGQPGYVPKHKTRITQDQFWLHPGQRADVVALAGLSKAELLREHAACWKAYYSLPAILGRMRKGVGKSWPAAGKLAYLFVSLAFCRVYAEHGVSADSVQRGKMNMATKLLIQTGVGVYSFFFRRKAFRFRVT
ncbi:MAG: Radical domain protein [Candidatus Solibacter sp.]|jgi:radical SAM superfamily enzyme YgiQ (UPF0313 family)|nr:Radical domain protein [Candidatus Solibacter sp.]